MSHSYVIVLCSAFMALLSAVAKADDTTRIDRGEKKLANIASQYNGASPAVVSFTAVPQKGEPVPIVIQWNPADGTGYNWDALKRLRTDDRRPDNVMRVSVEYLREGIARMTGRTPAVISSNDLSRGIVLTTLKGAPPELQNDPQVLRALRNTGQDAYNHTEAFYIRSEKDRVLVIANRWDGLSSGIVELLETIGYEVLGMGSSWVHAPDFHDRPLVFTVNRAERPSYYIRVLGGGSYYGSTYGLGRQPPDPADENIIASMMRWRTGFRIWGASMPPFPGHALDSYHKELLSLLKKTGTTEGFLTPRTLLGLNVERPAATEDNKGFIWINTDAPDAPDAEKIFVSNGSEWRLQPPRMVGANLDLSVPLVRNMVFETMKKRASAWFTAHPDDLYVFGTDPEDGPFYRDLAYTTYPNWYPEYLASEQLPFGRPYALHQFHGLDQPVEIWDPAAASDHVFGFHNWLLREYDKWIESLPPEQQITATGLDKKTRVRTSGYSYNYHDVPPNFNLDPRVRVMVAGYPKHRGAGKWLRFRTYRDLATAFRLLLPNEPSGEYRILSLADYGDKALNGIEARWSASPQALVEDYGSTFASGTKALTMEADLNYGKYGLGYYLTSKLLWNANLSTAELEALRDRWLQRAYGHSWQLMKQYYDFMLPETFPCNSPGTWARAIRMIDDAANKIDGEKDADVQRRFDEIKQFWYFYYFLDSGKALPNDPDFREFIWKAQTSYITSVDMVIDFFPDANRNPFAAAGDYAKGPARYTHAETQAWWNKVLNHWPLTEVDTFAEGSLSNGVAAGEVDLNDLVEVREFQSLATDATIWINRQPVSFLTSAGRPGEQIGGHLFWPHLDNNRKSGQRAVDYTVERWDTQRRSWVDAGDHSRVTGFSKLVTRQNGSRWQSIDIKLAAPHAGTYRFNLGIGGSDATVASLAYDVSTGRYDNAAPITYQFTKLPWRGTGNAWFYIPGGTRHLDFEMVDPAEQTLVLYEGRPSSDMKESRRIELSGRGTQRIALRPGEEGQLAHIERSQAASSAAPFNFPYLYSVPRLWARSPGALLLPRAIVKADGLTINEDD